MRKALLGVALALWLAPAAHAATRIIYASDWLGPTQIFAVDPTQKTPLGEVTFQHLPPCSASLYPITCGFIDPIPSPDGRHILFRSNGVDQSALWVANANGTSAQVVIPNLPFADPGPGHLSVAWSADSRRIRYGGQVVRIDGSSAPCCAGSWQRNQRQYQAYDESIVSPNGRWIASTKDGRITIANRRTNRTRVRTDEIGFELAWSPDSKALAYISGFMHFGTASTGDLRVVNLAGKVRTIVARNSRYGGEIVSVAWTRVRAKTRYRKPAFTNGIYAGGEVTRLAADGSHLAFSECDGVHAWSPPAVEPTLISPNPYGSSLCFPPTDRVAITDLALAGDRIAFVRSGGGLTPPLELWSSSLSNPAPVLLARGGTTVGSHARGVGTLAGAGDLLVDSVWDGRPAGTSSTETIVTSQSIYRVGSATCPCPTLASVPGQGEPVDVDDGRIVVLHAFWPDAKWTSRTPSLSILDRTDAQVLSLRIDAAAAQLAGPDLVTAERGSLVDRDPSREKCSIRGPSRARVPPATASFGLGRIAPDLSMRSHRTTSFRTRPVAWLPTRSTARSTSFVLPMERTELSDTDVTPVSWTPDWSTRTAHASILCRSRTSSARAGRRALPRGRCRAARRGPLRRLR